MMTQELLEDLTLEEKMQEKARLKKKEKKWRNKVNRIAKAEGIPVHEVERRLRAQENGSPDEEEEKQPADAAN
jgi:hypothetical protein